MLKVDASNELAKLLRIRAAGAGSDSRPIQWVVAFFNDFEQLLPVFSNDTAGTPA